MKFTRRVQWVTQATKMVSRISGLWIVGMIFALLPQTGFGQAAFRTRLAVDRAVIVSATVNRQPVQLCLDTGLGGPMVLSQRVAEALKLQTGGSTTLGDPSGTGTISVATAKLESVEIGGAIFLSVEPAIQPEGPMSRDCAGTVGLDLFKSYVATIDLANGELRPITVQFLPETLESYPTRRTTVYLKSKCRSVNFGCGPTSIQWAVA